MLQKQNVVSTEKTLKAINDLLRSQQETELAKACASVVAKGHQFFEEERIIESEKVSLEDQINKIVENYIEIQKKLDEELEARIRKIGEHIFRIVEEEGENLINDVSHAKQEAISELTTMIKEIYSRKTVKLQTNLSSCKTNIDSFIKQRESMVREIQSLLIDKSANRPFSFFVPFWIIETKNLKTGETEKTVYGPSNVEFTDRPRIQPLYDYFPLKTALEVNLGKTVQNLVSSDCGFRKSAEAGLGMLMEKGLLNRKIAERILKEKRLMSFDELAFPEVSKS